MWDCIEAATPTFLKLKQWIAATVIIVTVMSQSMREAYSTNNANNLKPGPVREHVETETQQTSFVLKKVEITTCDDKPFWDALKCQNFKSVYVKRII